MTRTSLLLLALGAVALVSLATPGAPHVQPSPQSGQVPLQWTPLSPAQALGYLDSALPPGHTRDGLLLVAAQSALETAWWGSKTGKGFANFNFGNVTPAGAQPWVSYPSIKGMKYRAFPDAPSGATAMVAWLKSHGALDAASAGDLDGYMAALERGCYLGCIGRTDPTGHTISQADYDSYRAGIASIMSQLSNVQPVAVA